MATRLAENKTDEKQLTRLAQKRVKLPLEWLEMKYNSEVDVLFIRCSANKSVRSKGDVWNGIIYDYDAQENLVSIEITDLYGVFV
ncbi:MAG: DUF2283 domain-containing protein [Acidobacteriota bacterium]|nr:DUF2283 domain-containing protein [Acidobacteriota bacterium]